MRTASCNATRSARKPAGMTGYTLLELLVVLVLLGLLATIAVSTYLGKVEGARVQKVETDFSTIATALSLYRLDTGMLPTTGQGLEALRQRPQLQPRPARYKTGGYLSALPQDPWGKPYLYLNPAQDPQREYDLYTLGADSKPGGEVQDADRYRN